MGCRQSSHDTASAADLKVVPLGPSLSSASSDLKSSIPKSSWIQLTVPVELFSWPGDVYKVTTKSGASFKGLKIIRQQVAGKDSLVLIDKSKPAAICLKQFELVGDTYKIYSTTPVYTGQEPSERKYNDKTKLYTYCKVERVPLSNVQQVTFANAKTPSIMIHCSEEEEEEEGTMEEGEEEQEKENQRLVKKKRVVSCHGVLAALIESDDRDPQNSYLLTVNPKADPCLIVCLAAVCDELDKTEGQ